MLIATDSDFNPAAIARIKAFIVTDSVTMNSEKRRNWLVVLCRPTKKYMMTPKVVELRKVMGKSTMVNARASTNG